MNFIDPCNTIFHIPGIYSLATVFCLAGCTTRTIIDRAGDRNESQSLSIAQFNEEVKDKSLTIQLRSGLKYSAEDISVSMDSTAFRVGANNTRISNDSIQAYLWKNHLGGAIEGFLFSVIPAALLSLEFEFNDAHGRLIPVVPAYVGAGVITIGSAIAGKSGYYEFLSDTVKSSKSNLDVRTATAHNSGNNDAGK